MTRRAIYFICTGNSCQSQMTEGWVKQILADDRNVYSAGTEAHGVNPKAIEAMKEVDIDISNHTSGLAGNNIIKNSSLIVTLCSDADVNCSSLPTDVKKEHREFDNPADRPWSKFQYVRGEIKIAIENFKPR